MSRSCVIRARIEPGLKEEVEHILDQLGLTTSETIHMLYRQIKMRQGLPFEVHVPNRLTTKTLKDCKNVKHFATKKDLYDDLGL